LGVEDVVAVEAELKLEVVERFRERGIGEGKEEHGSLLGLVLMALLSSLYLLPLSLCLFCFLDFSRFAESLLDSLEGLEVEWWRR